MKHADPLLDPDVYEHLRTLAGRIHSERRGSDTLQPTALMHEAWLKISGSSSTYRDRGHFMAIAARAMRQILVDHARGATAKKRGGVQRRTTLAGIGAETADPVDVLDLDAAITELAAERPSTADVASLRLFGGLTVPEAAESLGMSTRTVDRHWRVARAFLMQRLAQPNEA